MCSILGYHPQVIDVSNQIDVALHDTDVILLVDFIVLQKISLEKLYRLLQILLLVFVLLLNFTIHLDWLDAVCHELSVELRSLFL